MPRKVRDYKDEYQKYQGTEEQKKNRALRNNARRKAEASGTVHKGDGRDVDHKIPLSKGGSNSTRNHRIVKAGKNRAFARTKTGSMK